MTKLPDEVFDSLVANAEKYRGRHGSWKGAYYSAILAVSGIFITVSSISTVENEWVLTFRTLIIIMSLVSCFCCVWNMRMFLDLYNNLGFIDIPKTQEELDEYYNQQKREFEEFQEKAYPRKLRDDAILYCFVGSTIFVALSLYIPYIPCLN